MSNYRKGSAFELELLKTLFGRGLAVVRAAGSGVNPVSGPDLVVLRGGRAWGLECKAWSSQYLHLSNTQMEDLMKWGRMAGAPVVVGWKNFRTPWVFLLPSDFRAAGKNYMISWKEAQEKGKSPEAFFSGE
ncbi:MAG: hypothetical protein HY917_04055 [Candidatus Diapherotrites archaeon]|nr:hypothetical protein [Candidatus Diapherotrites archaeon]